MKKLFLISVTGHRFIANNRNLVDSIRKVLTGIVEEQNGFEIFLYSPLAEGSDQLIALVAQEFQEIELVVPLPLPVEEYLMDFKTRSGKTNFRSLLKSASKIINLPEVENHLSAYLKLGDFLVMHCDLLIAIWNGEYSGKIGGTGAVVEAALKTGKPIYWIYCNNKEKGVENILSEQKNEGQIQLLNYF